MGRSNGKRNRWQRGAPAAVLALVGTALLQTTSAYAVDLGIVPETRLRMTVVQWMPVEGEFRRLEALGGDLVVHPDGTVSIPVIGSVAAAGRDAGAISAEVAEKIRAKLGLITPPEVGLDVIEYPPFYVVGAVSTPGQFPYRPGFTVLQALAMGGGQLRADSENEAENRIRLHADIASIDDNIVRILARRARLRAQIDGASEVVFPREVEARKDDPVVREVMTQEAALFAARDSAIKRQLQSFDELVSLLQSEVRALEERGKALDENLVSLQAELDRVSELVDSGLATLSRRTDLERLIASARADRLDQTTAMLRSQQSISEAARHRADVADGLRTEAAQQLLAQEAELEDFYLKRETTRQLIAAMVAKSSADTSGSDFQEPVLEFSIVRRAEGGAVETPAEESTALLPGDVVKVTLSDSSFEVGSAGL